MGRGHEEVHFRLQVTGPQRRRYPVVPVEIVGFTIQGSSLRNGDEVQVVGNPTRRKVLRASKVIHQTHEEVRARGAGFNSAVSDAINTGCTVVILGALVTIAVAIVIANV
jgi:hypothetical protein